MNILIIGGGGRTHAFCWKIKQSKLCSKLFIAPGNAGTAQLGENINISESDFLSLKKACISNKIDLVLVGPEDPLVKGIYDFFKNDPELNHVILFGPSAQAAMLEGSKAFAKAFMIKHNIPTAAYKEFDVHSYQDGLEYIKDHKVPIVLKADGLAAGKGVIVCNNAVECLSEFDLMIQKAKFGSAGERVVVEEFLDGIELSIFILTDGNDYVLLPEAKDYKKVFEGDKGPNTGGMGAISPVPFVSGHFMDKIIKKVIEPTLNGLKEDGISYKGFIFFGLIKVDDEPMVIEYNCRMGDPETEVVLLRLKNDLLELIMAAEQHELPLQKIEISEKAAAAIVAVSGGYPGDYRKGLPIDFGYLENTEAIKHVDSNGGAIVFHAGTMEANEQVVTNGGRVLVVSSLADSLAEAVELSKDILGQIYFDGMHYRRDIGYEFID